MDSPTTRHRCEVGCLLMDSVATSTQHTYQVRASCDTSIVHTVAVAVGNNHVAGVWKRSENLGSCICSITETSEYCNSLVITVCSNQITRAIVILVRNEER